MPNKVTSCNVRMYTIGTGDCFVLSFKNDTNDTKFQLMIDCGVYNITKKKMEPFAKEIIAHTKGEVDALLITHEHQDHVLGFQRCEEIFSKELKIKELWLPWTENENDSLVKKWKGEYAKKKKTLAIASSLLSEKTKDPLFKEIYNIGPQGKKSFSAREEISQTLIALSDLNTDPIEVESKYIGGLRGMKVVKEKIQRERERFLETGSIIENIEGLDNIRIYILGPPKLWTDVKTEHGKEGETYKHNKELESIRAFSSLPFEDDDWESRPFNNDYIVNFNVSGTTSTGEKENIKNHTKQKTEYSKAENTYRRIDYDWLMSAANLSLRLTRGINNLSAVLAIEFIDSGKVMLFPGDAEYGSWKSWHEIEWDEKGKDGTTHLTTDLLNRTVFYKVAHHLSHNGTAKEKGLDLMTNKELVAMATLDYNVISKNWKNTMPNRNLIKDLLNKTKGRLIILNPDGLHFDKNKTIKLSDEIDKRFNNLSLAKQAEFKVTRTKNYVDYIVNGK